MDRHRPHGRRALWPVQTYTERGLVKRNLADSADKAHIMAVRYGWRRMWQCGRRAGSGEGRAHRAQRRVGDKGQGGNGKGRVGVASVGGRREVGLRAEAGVGRMLDNG